MLDKDKSILIVSMFCSFISTFLGSSINIALPLIGNEFHMKAVKLGWVATSFLLASAIFMVISGKFADILSRKKMMIFGMAGFSLVSFLTVFIKEGNLFILSRVIHGIFSPIIFTSANSLLIYNTIKEKRGEVLGLNITATYLGLTTGPFIGGFLIHILGWRGIFLIIFFLSLISFFMIIFFIKSDFVSKEKQRFDILGSFFYSGFIFFFICGLILIPGSQAFFYILTGIIFLIIFTLIEKKSKSPLIDVNIFLNNKIFAFSNLATLIHYSSTSGVIFLLSIYLQNIKNLTPDKAGLIIMIQPLLMALLSSFAGKLSDKKEPGKIASAGMTIIALGLFILSFINEKTSVLAISLNLVITGLGFAFFSSPNTNAIMSSIEKKYYGFASGFTGTMRIIGQLTGIVISTMFFSIFLKDKKINIENADLFLKSMKTSFLFFSLLCLLGIWMSLMRIKKV